MTEEASRPHRIIIAYDFSELAERAVWKGLALANADADTELHVLAVGALQGDMLKLPEAEPMSHADASEHVRAKIAKVVEDYQQAHGALRLDKVAVYASEGHPSEQIVALAEELDADLIVMGTHSRTGLSRIMLGSVAEAVVRRAPCGVLVIRPRDFLKGEKLPEIQAPLSEGERALPHFRPRAVFHYVSRVGVEPDRVIPSTY